MSGTRFRSRFVAPRMDCAADERLVRMALGGHADVHRIDVDLATREVSVVHDGSADTILRLLAPLRFEARLVDTGGDTAGPPLAPPRDESATLSIVLAINAVMFAGEATAGWLAESAALLADSLDMFADAAVYGMALYGVSRSRQRQVNAARLSGILQLGLALGALGEVARRALAGSDPEPPLMAGVAAIALVANATCLWLLARHRHAGAHMKASWIFTTNDVIANAGVILAALLVAMTGSAAPDLVVGTAIGLVVLSGAIRILRLPAP